MKLVFIFSHLNAIVLTVWTVFLVIIAIRFFYPARVGNISYSKLFLVALGLNIFYGLFVSFSQYYVWANAGDLTRSLLNAPLSEEVPLWQWTRPLFENHLGYFLHYILGRFWLNIFVSFLTSGILYLVFKLWKFYRGGFLEQGPELLLALMLISGWPGILVLVPLGFIFSIFLFCFSYFRGNRAVCIEPAFIFAAFFALFFTRIILNVL